MCRTPLKEDKNQKRTSCTLFWVIKCIQAIKNLKINKYVLKMTRIKKRTQYLEDTGSSLQSSARLQPREKDQTGSVHLTIITLQNHLSHLICVVWTRYKDEQPCKWVFAWHRIAVTPWTWATFASDWMYLNVRFQKLGIERISPFPRRPLRVRCVKKLPISHTWRSRKNFTAQR